MKHSEWTSYLISAALGFSFGTFLSSLITQQSLGTIINTGATFSIILAARIFYSR